ncbi:MAG: IPT/TIG domain-containing protein [Dehalococcoidia bacterium]
MTPVRRFQAGLAAALMLVAMFAATSLPRTALAASSPTIISLTPAQGPSSGGTAVTLVGTDFQAGVTVHIGGFLASSVVRVSTTQVTLITPPSATTTGGAANILVQNPDGGVATLNSGFFYTAFASPLTITSVEPSTGPNTGGTNVTIAGTGFSSAVSVYFGDVPAAVVNPLGSSAIFARTPANVSGPVAVTVINPDGQKISKANGFTYTGGVGVRSVAPGGGAPAGGTTIVVTGDGFKPGATVQIGSGLATNVQVVNSAQIVATSPAGSIGAQRVTVTNPDGQSGFREQGFSYGPAAGVTLPTISGISPSTGPSHGGTQLTLTGTGFSGGSTVYFGGVASPLVSWNGTSSMFVQTPASMPGPVDVTVVNNDGGTVTLANGFTFEGGAGTVIATAAPTTGPAGTVVVLNGTGFNAGSWVTFGGVPARSTTVVGSSQIIATVPAGVSGTVPIAVTQVGLKTPVTTIQTFTVTGVTTPPVTPPVTTPPVTPPVTTPPASGGAGGFAAPPRFSASGQALVIFGGGTPDQLETAASAAGATGVWVQDATGAYQLLVVGGPAFLKDQFRAQFPGGIGANTPASLTR